MNHRKTKQRKGEVDRDRGQDQAHCYQSNGSTSNIEYQERNRVSCVEELKGVLGKQSKKMSRAPKVGVDVVERGEDHEIQVLLYL